MQTLFIPDRIQIDFLEGENKPLRQGKILIGIKTLANLKNNIDLSPFLTDQNGTITITAEEIKERAANFVSYGVMDYASLETAKPGIEIYYWGNNNLDSYISYWTELLQGRKDLKQFEKWGDKLGKRDREAAEIERRERQVLELYSTCSNRRIRIAKDKVLLQDSWDKPNREINYKIKLDLK